MTTKDWAAAKMVAGNDNLDDQLRSQVRRCTNAAVTTAYLSRGDVGADEAFALCADERRPGVLTTLSRHSGTERGRYLGLLLHAYQAGGNVGLAKAILDASGTQSVDTVPEATAANILVLLAGKRSPVSSHQLGVINRWREGLTGANASAVIGAGRIVDWGYIGHLWLLTAPGRDTEQIHADTCGWLNAQWHGADKAQLQRLTVQLVRNLGTTCGWSAQTAVVADAIRDWVRDEGGDSAEIATHIRALAGVPVIARPDGFTAVETDTVDATSPFR